MIAGLLRALADRIEPRRRDPRATMPVAARSLFDDEHLHGQRNEDVMSLLDEECCGYILLQLRNERGYLRINPSFAVPPEAWPAMKETLARCALEAERVYG